jgi:hypothetical protein
MKVWDRELRVVLIWRSTASSGLPCWPDKVVEIETCTAASPAGQGRAGFGLWIKLNEHAEKNVVGPLLRRPLQALSSLFQVGKTEHACAILTVYKHVCARCNAALLQPPCYCAVARSKLT